MSDDIFALLQVFLEDFFQQKSLFCQFVVLMKGFFLLWTEKNFKQTFGSSTLIHKQHLST